jgi:small subunit ribosomal protein S6
MNRTYEVMYIIRPDLTEEEVDKIVSTMESNVAAAGGTVKSTDRMGKRRLAYIVRKFSEGVYVLMTFEASGEVVHEVERRLRVSEPVIKFITVRVDELQKKLNKVQALRAKHVKRSATEVPAGAVEAQASAGSEAAPANA